MLIVKTSVRLSAIHGLGLFAAESIKKGQAIWVFDPLVDGTVFEREFSKFTESRKATVSHFGFKNSRGDWVIRGDGSLFINHSDEPNMAEISHDEEFPNSREPVMRATRNISVGDELTLSYL
jgi:SET domain-containing protein